MSICVCLNLHSDAPFLSATGQLVRETAPPADGGMPNATIRNLSCMDYQLDDGRYLFSFRVKNGAGKFVIKALRANGHEDIWRKYDTSKDGFENLEFRFVVTS